MYYVKEYNEPNQKKFKKANAKSKREVAVESNAYEFEIEEVVDHMFTRNETVLFRVRWSGYNELGDSWEPSENLKNAKLALQNYLNKKNLEIDSRLQGVFRRKRKRQDCGENFLNIKQDSSGSDAVKKAVSRASERKEIKQNHDEQSFKPAVKFLLTDMRKNEKDAADRSGLRRAEDRDITDFDLPICIIPGASSAVCNVEDRQIVGLTKLNGNVNVVLGSTKNEFLASIKDAYFLNGWGLIQFLMNRLSFNC
ncbi:unnamed protein product [Auanema sp. JU1783]|nr:unnamed protein product [Auanema sp. JU1783]